MRFEITTASLLASTAAAFSNSSPYVLFSTSSNLPNTNSNDQQLLSTSQVLETTHDSLASCPTSRYLLISQSNVHASDLRHPATGKCLAPRLCEAATADNVHGGFNAAEVVGRDGISMLELETYISSACAGKSDVFIEGHVLDALPAEKDARSAKVAENDIELGRVLSGAGNDYTVIYFSPGHEESKTYESEYVESPAIQMELKRSTGDVVERKAAKGGNSSEPLFVKYQFFTPGIFMGIVAVLIMLAILYVGLSAVSSLEVSYGAFDKDMGPAAQKKNI
ncbi:Protein big1 [Cytospora mali]|uniref:Protein BIG1 n=1 Tax=Cytospora mali TaxID=578113 RepID=A0A194V050_CYTMA|nr:Protein big1 [Valsa mali var. pyri (nom. inval.)]